MKSVKCRDITKVTSSKVSCNCNCECKQVEKIANRRVCVKASPSFPIEVANRKRSKKEELVLDTGCTAESIVNEDFAKSLGLPITPTNVQSATLGDGQTAMTIVGEIEIKTKFLGNPIDIRHQGCSNKRI